jgi:DMSO/TMAO reductase YedYZ molybdopterin-dependent catalytic subunit
MRRWIIAACTAGLLNALPAAYGADQPGASGVTVAGPSSEPVALDDDFFARFPVTKLSVSFLSGQGQRSATFTGPLLWSVLEQAKALDPAQHQGQVSQFVVLTGRDGYRAVLALAELAPEFEGKQVIVAREMDDKPLGPDHLRIVVPADKRGGRSVRDIARIEVKTIP